jgi:hypothetical protein
MKAIVEALRTDARHYKCGVKQKGDLTAECALPSLCVVAHNLNLLLAICS